jgi:hypothetical protein
MLENKMRLGVVSSVSRAAAAHFVGPLGRWTPSTFATLRVDRLAARETELTAPNLILL